MAKAIWNGQVVAESDTYETVDGNVYFPPGAIKRDLLEESQHHTICGWKGEASYYDLVVDGKRNTSAAWYYPDPKPKAAHFKDFVAFWNGVAVEK
jgi:uncharacterized protein (DUF427 family)